MKCFDLPGRPLSPPAVTARARTLSFPNSTTATKLLPLVPYHFLVPVRGAAPNEASEPKRADVNATGMLGLESSNGCTISGLMRWKRLISPHGVFQLPKSAGQRSDRRRQAWSSRSGVARVAAYSADDMRRGRGRARPSADSSP